MKKPHDARKIQVQCPFFFFFFFSFLTLVRRMVSWAICVGGWGICVFCCGCAWSSWEFAVGFKLAVVGMMIMIVCVFEGILDWYLMLFKSFRWRMTVPRKIVVSSDVRFWWYLWTRVLPCRCFLYHVSNILRGRDGRMPGLGILTYFFVHYLGNFFLCFSGIFPHPLGFSATHHSVDDFDEVWRRIWNQC